MIVYAHEGLLKFAKSRVSQLPKNSIQFLRNSKTTLPVFHCLPKLHKVGMPGRPIVGAPSWITTNWSILLDCLLENTHIQYALKNSINIIPDLENFNMQTSYLLCSADVASLYTNMSLPRLYRVLDSLPNGELNVKILRFICGMNLFRYGDYVYRQSDGIAMGTNCAVVCANLYLDEFDKLFAPRCLFYRRYIDIFSLY